MSDPLVEVAVVLLSSLVFDWGPLDVLRVDGTCQRDFLQSRELWKSLSALPVEVLFVIVSPLAVELTVAGTEPSADKIALVSRFPMQLDAQSYRSASALLLLLLALCLPFLS